MSETYTENIIGTLRAFASEPLKPNANTTVPALLRAAAYQLELMTQERDALEFLGCVALTCLRTEGWDEEELTDEVEWGRRDEPPPADLVNAVRRAAGIKREA
jgi:hypothetical protein